MGIERTGEPFKKEKDQHGRPLFVSEVEDKDTGVIRRVEKSILSEQGGILFSQTDTFPALGLARIILRTSNLPEKGLPKHLFGVLEEEIAITEIKNRSNMFTIFGTQYREGDKIKVEAIYVNKALWDGIGCGVYYNEDGKISEIFIEPDPEVVREDEKFNMVKISMGKDGPYFEVINGNQPLGQNVIKSRKIEATELFGSQDFSCEFEDSEDRVLVRIEYKKSKAGKRTISFSKSVDVDKLYTIAATDGFTGWEKVLDEVDKTGLVW